MLKRTFGEIHAGLLLDKPNWIITEAEPHVRIRLKNTFTKIPRTGTPPFHITNSPENCYEIEWFLQRYPLVISDEDYQTLLQGKQDYINHSNRLEGINLPGDKPRPVFLKEGQQARGYQLQAREVMLAARRLILGDDMGLGKTLTATICCLEPGALPAAVVCQAHLPLQWAEEINKFTNLTVHIIKKSKPYDLPPADIYIFKYSILRGWTDIFDQGIFKTVIFDECQELRTGDAAEKYTAAKVLASKAIYCYGLSGTPIFNYTSEIWNILNCIKPGCLGDYYDFSREWSYSSGDNRGIDTKALGAYLREQFLFYRRTRAEVGKELPVVNRIVHYVNYSAVKAHEVEQMAYKLAIQVTSGSFAERGSAARELSIYLRYETGVAKAIHVANYVKTFFLSQGVPIVLSGWHRDVYKIWNEQLHEYNPVMYTGTESPKQKAESLAIFNSGKSDVFIISNRSGVGLNGLQERCKTVVIGEPDYSPKVHDQIITRVDREGQQSQVTAVLLFCDYGSDPTMMDILGVKASISQNIVDPFQAVPDKYSDDSNMKILAENIIKRHENKVS